MIRTRVRKILRDVWARKGRTALVSLAIFIGVAGTISLFSMSDILVGQIKEDIKQDLLSMGQIAVTADTGVQLDNAAYLNRLSDFPGVSSVMAGIEEIPTYFKVEESDEEFEEGYVQAYLVLNEDGTELVDAPFEAEVPIEPYRLLEGGEWPDEGQNELLVERRMADEYDLEVGDTLYMRVLSPSRDPEKDGATGTVEVWTITGIVFDPYNLNPSGAIFTYHSDANYLTGRTSLNDIWVRFIDWPTAEDSFDEFASLLAQETPYTPAFSESQDPAENALVTSAETISNLMSFLALVSLIVSGFLVVNVITSIVTEQKRQIGVMKSIGATRWDNFFIYSGIALVYGVIGVIPGVIVGIPAGNAIANALAPQLNTVLEGFNISPFSIILGVLVGLAVPVIASLLPVFRGTRVEILDAMTDLGIGVNYGTGPIARLIAILPLPITVRQGLSNVSIKKGRLVFTVLTLAVAVGAFMGIYALFASLTNGINVFIDSFNVELALFPFEARDPDQFQALLEDNFPDDIAYVEPGMQLQVEFEGYDPEPAAGGPPGIFAYGYAVGSENPAFNFEIDEGEELTEENRESSIILSSLLAANMDKEVGDVVVLQTPGGTRALTVVGIAEFPLDQCWIDWRVLSEIADYTFDSISVESPLPADFLPPEAGNFIKYASAAELDGYEASGPLPGVPVLGLLPGVADYVTFSEGEFFTPGEPGVIVSSDLAANGGYSAGDTITLASLADGGQTLDLPVVGVMEPLPLLGAAGIPPDFVGMFWRDAVALDGGTIESKPRPGGFFVTTPLDDPSAEDLDEIADRMNDYLAGTGNPVFVLNFVELTDQISETFFTIQAILSAVAGLIALVGALGLLTTLSMSVFERQKEIGVMRSIGAGSSTVAIQFLTEGLVVGIISWVVGLPLMVVIQMLLLNVTGFSETFPFEVSPTAILIGLVGMVVVTTISSLWPSLSAARKTVSDILRYQ
jgi:ABC-type antimicrobial peptide transport system permease subunit